MMPSIVIGTSMGYVMNKVTPPQYIVIGQAVIGVALFAILMKKFFKTRREEIERLGPMKWCGGSEVESVRNDSDDSY